MRNLSDGKGRQEEFVAAVGQGTSKGEPRSCQLLCPSGRPSIRFKSCSIEDRIVLVPMVRIAPPPFRYDPDGAVDSKVHPG